MIDERTRPELVSQALQRFCENKTGLAYIPPGCPWVNGHKECLNRNHWNTPFEARVVIGDFKHEHSHRHPPFGSGLPHADRIRCGI
ncbi:transposase [Mycobacterium malmoense]|uniref:transposase n=2 Tax=Mycobacterium malmoense TaxID=1780 RepID=UPI00114D4CF7|nr:transposase [Mycobacterium malmoense]